MNLDYSQKPNTYFRAARKPFVDVLPHNPDARLLEIGCGTGDTAAYALAEKKCGWCCGVELCQGPADEARTRLQQVIVGDVERLDLDLPERSIDILLLSEVLEHLADPWRVLQRLRKLMRPDSVVIAGSPNVCHHSVLLALIRGEWRYETRGVFDATHLRWFSPSSYRAMFESCGFIVDSVGPARALGHKARVLNILAGGRLQHLFHTQIVLKGHSP